jgi:hypothetical protein
LSSDVHDPFTCFGLTIAEKPAADNALQPRVCLLTLQQQQKQDATGAADKMNGCCIENPEDKMKQI